MQSTETERLFGKNQPDVTTADRRRTKRLNVSLGIRAWAESKERGHGEDMAILDLRVAIEDLLELERSIARFNHARRSGRTHVNQEVA